MLCEHCGQTAATHHYKQNINGELRETHLCGECAGKFGAVPSFPFGEDMQGKLNALFSGLSAASAASHAPRLRACPVCGETAEGIAKTGYVGCAACYKVFSPLLAPHIAKLYGKTAHTGRTPAGRENPKRQLERSIDRLLSEQAEAIRKEDFERAAALRDQIAELKKDMGNTL